MSKFRELRGKRAKRVRKVDIFAEKIRVLIVCEGGKTEPYYFSSFKLRLSFEVEIIGRAGNTISLVDYATRLVLDKDYRIEPKSLPKENADEVEYSDKIEYDVVWCVFDRDSFPTGHFNSAIDTAKDRGFKVAYTNEAFELWYILHFNYHTSSLPRGQYKSILQRDAGRPYSKTSKDMYDFLLPYQATAIRNAQRLMGLYNGHHNPESDNPCTTVHELVEFLNDNLA